MSKKIKQLHPVYDFRNRFAALLGHDTDVTVTLDYIEDGDDQMPIFDIIVAGCAHKADAMRRMFNGTFKIGNIVCALWVNGEGKSHKEKVDIETIATAFSGNSLFSRIYVKYNGDAIDKWCLLWKNETVVFPNDQLNSYCGMECHSAEDLARLVLTQKINSVLMHATEVGESNGYWDHILS